MIYKLVSIQCPHNNGVVQHWRTDQLLELLKSIPARGLNFLI